MAITQSELTDLFEYGIDTKNRKIYFGYMSADPDSSTEFNSTSVEFAVRALHKMTTEAPNKAIELHLNSFGGSIYDALRLHDEILASSSQVKFYGGGAIMSAATIIMVACDERYLHQHATVMIHELSTSNEGRHTDVQVGANENRRLMDILYTIYEENTRMPAAFWQDICIRDTYLSPSEAVSLGLADFIVEPKKRGNLRKKRFAALKKDPNTKDMNKLIKDIYERINKKKVPKIELNEVKKEAADPHLFIDDKPAEIKTPEVTPAPTDISVKKD